MLSSRRSLINNSLRHTVALVVPAAIPLSAYECAHAKIIPLERSGITARVPALQYRPHRSLLVGWSDPPDPNNAFVQSRKDKLIQTFRCWTDEKDSSSVIVRIFLSAEHTQNSIPRNKETKDQRREASAKSIERLVFLVHKLYYLTPLLPRISNTDQMATATPFTENTLPTPFFIAQDTPVLTRCLFHSHVTRNINS
nr:hypothetical protein CFP56_73553 [Quercus suber]